MMRDVETWGRPGPAAHAISAILEAQWSPTGLVTKQFVPKGPLVSTFREPRAPLAEKATTTRTLETRSSVLEAAWLSETALRSALPIKHAVFTADKRSVSQWTAHRPPLMTDAVTPRSLA